MSISGAGAAGGVDRWYWSAANALRTSASAENPAVQSAQTRDAAAKRAENFAGVKVEVAGAVSQAAFSPSLYEAVLSLQATPRTQDGAPFPVEIETANGGADIDLDAYFSNEPVEDGLVRLSDAALLIPSAGNIQALTQHASARFKDLLAAYDIPSAPQTITYDQKGEAVLPRDYPYADELKQALADNPGLDKELRTLNALSSHYVGLQRVQAFQDEYAKAQSQAEIDAVLRKHSDLFGPNRRHASIALNFSPSGDISVTAGGAPLRFS